jgi:hypothetical protein
MRFFMICFLLFCSVCQANKDQCFQKTTVGQSLDCRHDEKIELERKKNREFLRFCL